MLLSHIGAVDDVLVGAVLIAAALVVATCYIRRARDGQLCKACDEASSTNPDVTRTQRLLAEGILIHPTKGTYANFTDLAHALATLCDLPLGDGASKVRPEEAEKLVHEIGRHKKHVIFCLCDGMGVSTLEAHLPKSAFLRRHNHPDRLVAVFPSTTPAALTTLATGAWPGQHGAPGWDLRDQMGCEYPGEPVRDAKEAPSGPVQIRVLHKAPTDMRTGAHLYEMGFDAETIYAATPWANPRESSRRMFFVNAYNRTEFPIWYRGDMGPAPTMDECAADIGCSAAETVVGHIDEINAAELGTRACVEHAVDEYGKACDQVLQHATKWDRAGERTYSYIYTAHPDKHMHALGAEHACVGDVVRGLNEKLEALVTSLQRAGLDAALVISADHGHVTVQPEHMVVLNWEQLCCLEYANIGVHGKGRHAVFHCRSGRHAEFERAWRRDTRLVTSFVLLTVEEASDLGLFGPDPPKRHVRPRLGDFLAISLGKDTLCTPTEHAKWACTGKCQGAHGSLARDEMRIPFVLATTSAAE